MKSIIHISWCSRAVFPPNIPIFSPVFSRSSDHRMLPIWGEHQQCGEDLVGPLALDTLHGAFHAAVGAEDRGRLIVSYLTMKIQKKTVENAKDI